MLRPGFKHPDSIKQGKLFRENSPTEGLQLGIIERVRDYENEIVDIKNISGGIGRTEIPITRAVSGYDMGLYGMPMVGTRVIYAHVIGTSKLYEPYIVGYLSPVPNAAKAHHISKDAPTDEVPTVRLRSRKAYPGDILAYSSDGSDFVMDESILLENSRLNSIELRADDQTIYTNSLSFKSITDGGQVFHGQVRRDALLRTDDNYVDNIIGPNSSKYGKPYVGSEHKLINIIRTNQSLNYYDATAEFFNEFRVEVNTTGDGILNVDLNMDGGQAEGTIVNNIVKPKAPNVEFVLGTVIGNDPNVPEHYAKPLKLENGLFTICKPEEVNTNSIAILNKVVDDKGNTVYAHAVHKNGRVATLMGNSPSISINGALKTSLGKDNDGNSLNTSFGGAWSGSFGGDNNNTSMKLVLTHGFSMDIQGGNNVGDGYVLNTKGQYKETIEGNKIVSCAEYNGTYNGSFVNSIRGAQITDVVYDRDSHVGGNSSDMILGTKQEMITFTDTKTIGAGYIEHIIAGGSVSIVDVGVISRTAVVGAISDVAGATITHTAGAAIVQTAGAAITQTATGAIVQTAGAAISRGATGPITDISAATITLTAPLLLLGPLPVLGMGPLPGGPLSPFRDYITGLPYGTSATIAISL